MNSREQSLVILLIAVVSLGVGSFGVYKWFVQPLMDYRAQIIELEDKRDEEEGKWRVFVSERMKLAKARSRSLPAKPEQAKSEYSIAYLDPLLKQSGLKDVSITPSSTATDVKLSTPIPGIKKVGHQTLTFTVRATGDLKNLVTALDHLQRTPYEHRIKVLQIDREQPGKSENNRLLINMVIETLLVSKSEGKVGQSLVLEERALDRKYEDIAKKNIFVGEVPEYKYEKPPEKPPVKIVEKGPTAPPENVPAYVRLIHTSAATQEAFLRNRVYNTPEIHINLANKKLGLQTFKITDELGVYEFFTAKVLRVDSRDIYFQVADQVYALHIDQSVYDAMKNPLPMPLWRLAAATTGVTSSVYPRTFEGADAATVGTAPLTHPSLVVRYDPFGLVEMYDAKWAASEKTRLAKSKSKTPSGKGK